MAGLKSVLLSSSADIQQLCVLNGPIAVVFLEEFGVQRSHVAIHNWVHKADLQPMSTVSADQLAVDEKAIRINGDDYWLYGAVDPETNEILHFRLFPTATNRRRNGF